MKTHALMSAAALFAAFALIPNLQAQPLVTIETVTVGDAGNAADTRTNAGSFGYGAVADVFAIGKYEVTISQYNTFLNSVASVTSDSYIVDLWTPVMTSQLTSAGISRSGDGTLASPYSYSVIGPSGSITPAGASSPGNRPITYVSWFGAARFANWVNNGAVNGASTETGAYTLNGASNGIITKNAGATWFLPSEDQWYKAAYYKGGGTNAGYWLYPTESDTLPGNTIGGATNQANAVVNLIFSVTQSTFDFTDTQNYLTDVGAFSNSASAFDTFDQGGNVWEWNDAIGSSQQGVRGGSWRGTNSSFDVRALASTNRLSFAPTFQADSIGFRLAAVPEPSTYALILMAGAGWLLWKRRRGLNRG